MFHFSRNLTFLLSFPFLLGSSKKYLFLYQMKAFTKISTYIFFPFLATGNLCYDPVDKMLKQYFSK